MRYVVFVAKGVDITGSPDAAKVQHAGRCVMVRCFEIRLSSDSGTVAITVNASSPGGAVDCVLDVEKAPCNSVLSIREVYS